VARLAGIAAVLVLAVTAIGVTETPATVPGENGLIAYTADGSICAMDPDGSRRRRVTYARAWDGAPAWSPEGRRLSFSSERRWLDLTRSRRLELFVYDRRRIMDVTVGVEHPGDLSSAWSPDGQRIAVDYAEAHFGGVPFTIMNADGTERREVAPGNVPDWSPDGQWIAYESDVPTEVGREGLYVIRPDGSGKRRLATGSAPSWSPDGSQIAFAWDGIHIINADGTGLRRITGAPFGFDWGPSWSPDGRQIAFVRTADRDRDLWVVAPDGSGLRNLTNTPNVAELSVSWQRRPRSGAEEFELPRGARGCGQKIVDSDLDPSFDSLDGGPLDDLVFARGGNDRVHGLGGADILYGGSGNDVLLGGSGKDDLRGGSGRDLIGARDGAIDQITCGPGRDRVVADRRDRVTRDCERVSRR
jgi:Tol biopolymer transport system component